MTFKVNPHRRRYWAKKTGRRPALRPAMNAGPHSLKPAPTTPLDRPASPPGFLYCRAFGCEVAISNGRLFCRRHWRLLTEKDRQELLSAWKRCTTGQLEAAPQYLDAVVACVRHLRTLEQALPPLAHPQPIL